ncbi:L-rhamnose mutarotase [Aestuariibaculum suncheonense]|uniref:L-rhamnose mutarotase n=1 Tax=Aestuariibaculum suncheonense TaxID=1028745 RepID=A0A8J6U9I5_9FLAO|nr:L-rhamnose mutarotase [Aestuariibaculum suncheonense]MBD0834208.1 L-rhamnose mutarotase [Aestuariibaculum suncheonense]
MGLTRYCLACDLKDNPELIAEYIQLHQKVWPEILESIKESGIEDMEIFNIGNRLFMIMEVNDTFSFERKTEMDANNPKVQEWENFMWKFQQELPMARPGEKWILLDSIFRL